MPKRTSIPSVQSNDVIDHAEAFAENGLYVVPVKNGTKNPGTYLGAGWDEKSSNDLDQVTAWFSTDNGELGMALHAGRSGLVVIDVDDWDELPENLLKAINDLKPPFQSTRADDPRRGHYLFLQPQGRMLGNSNGKLGKTWGEIRGNNGVIIVAPTIHESSHQEPGTPKYNASARYKWIRTGLIPELPEYVHCDIPNAMEKIAMATDRQVYDIKTKYTSNDVPTALLGILSRLSREIEDGESRHNAARDALCFAMRESMEGRFPAEQAILAIRNIFNESTGGDISRKWEFDNLVSWAAAVAESETDEERVQRVAARDARQSDMATRPTRWEPASTGGTVPLPGTTDDVGVVADVKVERRTAPEQRAIPVDHRNDAELLDDVIEGMLAFDGTEPRIFRSGNDVVALNPRSYELSTLDQGSLRIEVARRVQMFVVREVKERIVDEDGKVKIVRDLKRQQAPVPKTLLESMLSSPDERFLECRMVSNTGFFTPEGTWWDREGYSAEAKVFCTGRIQSDPIPETPTGIDVQKAVDEINKTIAEFPFVNEASRTHALSMVLLPFVRNMIDGPTPLHLIQSPDAGTGKSLLMETVLYPAFGNVSMADTPARKEEMIKATFAALRQAPQYLIMDNLQEGTSFGSQELAKILTSYPTHQGRVLGTSTTEKVPTTCVWGATGNNPNYASDIARRAIGIELDAGQKVLGRTFAIKNLRGYLQENRPKLIAAAATIIRAWIQAGRPAWSANRATLDSFESWALVMGGITEFAGLKGFLANQDALSDANNGRKSALEELVEVWNARDQELQEKGSGSAMMTAAALLEMAEEANVDLGLVGRTDRELKVALGFMLRPYMDSEKGPGKRFRTGQSLMKKRDSTITTYVLSNNKESA